MAQIRTMGLIGHMGPIEIMGRLGKMGLGSPNWKNPNIFAIIAKTGTTPKIIVGNTWSSHQG